jgi:predicted thioesterase
MEFKLHNGLNAKVEAAVTQDNTADSFGSGGVQVFATPMMIGLMEKAALSAVDPYLPCGYATVGARLDIRHTAATPMGMKVYAAAELTEIDGKRLVFKVEAYDEKEKIGEGCHERYIVNIQRFMEKAADKVDKS